MDGSDRDERIEAEPVIAQERAQPSCDSGKDSLGEALRQAVSLEDEDKETLRDNYAPEPGIHFHQTIYYGNHVENSGTIQGGISQAQAARAAASDTRAKTFAGTENDIHVFFQEEHPGDTLAAVIALAELGRVPENRFFQVAKRLESILGQSEQAAEEKLATMTIQLKTAEALIAPFPICRDSLWISFGSEKQEMCCLTFAQEGMDKKIRDYLWESFPQLRATLTEWLVELHKTKGTPVDYILAYAAVGALSEHAASNPGHAFCDLVPLLEKACTTQADVKYLTRFVEGVMERESCRAAVDELLCRWCDRRDGYLWQIPYRLFGRDGEWRFRHKVQIGLADRLKKDIDGAGSTYLAWYRRDRGYLLSPAHKNKKVADLIVAEMAAQYKEDKPYHERYRIAVYFLSLLRWDYLTDFSAEPELVFLRCFYNQALREKLQPLLHFVWQRLELREVAGNIIAHHFAKIDRCGASWEYLKKPFQFLAFTKTQFDYKATCSLLDECTQVEGAARVARGLKKFLVEELRSKRTEALRDMGVVQNDKSVL